MDELVLELKNLKDFTIYGCGGHIVHVNIFSFHQPQVALNGIWLQLAPWLLRRCLKLSYYTSPGSKVKQWP